MLEKMGPFFDRRLDGYEEHQLNCIDSAREFYPFGSGVYDAAVSVESLHHFTKEEKIPLYRKLHQALKHGGYFILTDYFSVSEEEETFYQTELSRLKALQGITDSEFYHYDTPLTVKHEMEALSAAGFSSMEILKH